MLKNRILRIAVGAACLWMLMVSPAARAQQASGAVTGTVSDPAGSAVVGATVTVRDVDRGTIWKTASNSSGNYDFPQISVGNLQVSAEAPGFSKEVRSPFALVLNQEAKVDFHLQVGKVNETVTVNEEAPLLQTGTTEVGTVIDANAVANLPMASRDIYQLTLLAPGVTSPNIFAFQSSQTTFGTGRPYVNGARE